MTLPDDVVERVAQSLCSQLDLNGHTLDGIRTAARAALEAAGYGEQQQRLRALHEALTPSAATKAAYIGEFSFLIDEQQGDGVCEVTRKIDVPWTTIKEIMAAILGRAALLSTIGAV